LRDGSRIAVIGGGPAGSFFALHALTFAHRRHIRLEVIVFEPKDFTARGPLGCNKCAGILSSRLVRNLWTLGLTLPPHVILGHIQAYVLHLDDLTLEIARPEPWRDIVSIYRGGGPRLGTLDLRASFDAWLLGRAQARGTHLVGQRVEEVNLLGRPVVRTQDRRYECDLVVLACGVNARRIPLIGTNYTPPATETMAQDEILIPGGDVLPGGESIDGRVHIFFGRPAGILFAGLVPKGPYTNVSLLGHHLSKDPVADFLDAVGGSLSSWERAGVRGESGRLCGCRPRIAVSMARGIYSDRFVAVGDAAATRLYKDGIGSAFLTARQAAEAAVLHDVSADSFARHYAPLCRAIDRDNRIGRLVFALWDPMMRSSRLTDLWVRALTAEQSLPPVRRRLHLALWGMFTGDDSYRDIAASLLKPEVAGRFLMALRPGYLPEFSRGLKPPAKSGGSRTPPPQVVGGLESDETV
jgi:flavin-dependent dehydrogenase